MADNTPQSVDSYAPNSEVGSIVGGSSVGIGNLINTLFGMRMWPQMNPGGQQSMYDTLLHRQRDLSMLNLAGRAVTSSYPFQNMGMNENSFTTRIVGQLMSDPDGLASKIMRPILGGNPISSQMSSYATLQGIGGAALGTSAGQTPEQVSQAFSDFSDVFYSHGLRTRGKDFGSSVDALTNLKDGMGNKVITLSTDSLNALKDLGKKGGSAEDLREGINKLPENIISSNDKQKIIDGVFEGFKKGMDYSHNLGLSINTLTTFRDQMIKDRLISTGGDVNNLGDISRLFGGADGARIPMMISAAKGVWGSSMPDSELTQRLNDFIGKSGVDVGQKSGSDAVEDALRQIKGTARESNIDINELLGLHSQLQEVASQSPTTAMIGGLQLSRLLTEKAQQITTLATDGSAENNKLIRQQGGTEGMIRNQTLGELQLAQQPMPSMLAALRTYIRQTTAGDETPEGQNPHLDEFDRYARGEDPKFSLTNAGIHAFMQHAVPNPGAAFQYAYNNPYAANEGFNDNPDLQHIGNRMLAQKIQFMVHRMTTPAVEAKFNKLIKEGNWTELQSDTDINRLDILRNNIAGAVKSGAFEDMRINANPALRLQRDASNAAIKAGKAQEIVIDKTMGEMRPDTITKLVQSLASGTLGEKGISGIFETLGVGPKTDGFMGLTADAHKLSNLGRATTIEDVATIAGKDKDIGALNDLSGVAKKYNLNAEQMGDVAHGNFDALPKNLTKDERRDLQVWAQGTVMFKDDKGAYDFNQTFDAEGYKKYYQNKVGKSMSETFWQNRGLDKQFQGLAETDIGSLIGDSSTETVGKAVQTLSGGGKDYNAGFKVIDDILTGKGSPVKQDDGNYTLPENYQKALNALGGVDSLTPEQKAHFTGANTPENVAARMADIKTTFSSNKAVTTLDETYGKKETLHKGVTVEGAQTLDQMVKTILDKLTGLKEISGSIDKLTAKIS